MKSFQILIFYSDNAEREWTISKRAWYQKSSLKECFRSFTIALDILMIIIASTFEISITILNRTYVMLIISISITILNELMWCWSSYLLLVPDLVRLQLNSSLQVGVVILNLVVELHWKIVNLQSVPLDIVPYIHRV